MNEVFTCIPDMPFPTGCAVCGLSYLGYDEDDCPVDICALTNQRVWNDFEERAEDCPLKPCTEYKYVAPLVINLD